MSAAVQPLYVGKTFGGKKVEWIDEQVDRTPDLRRSFACVQKMKREDAADTFSQFRRLIPRDIRTTGEQGLNIRLGFTFDNGLDGDAGDPPLWIMLRDCQGIGVTRGDSTEHLADDDQVSG